MSRKPALCIQVNEEIQLRLLEERPAENYFALVEHNKEYFHEWIAVFSSTVGFLGFINAYHLHSRDPRDAQRVVSSAEVASQARSMLLLVSEKERDRAL